MNKTKETVTGYAGFEGPKTYLYRIAMAKVAKEIVKLILSALAAHKLDALLTNAGVSVDWQHFEASLMLGLFGAIEFARNYLKNKKKFKWAQWL